MQPGSRQAAAKAAPGLISMMDSNIHDQPSTSKHQKEEGDDQNRATSNFGGQVIPSQQSVSEQLSEPNFDELFDAKNNEILGD